MSFYRGYITVGTDKKPLMKFKEVPDKELLTLEQAETKSGYAGVMAKDSILVDIDNKAESEILFKICTELKVKCRILKTDRGRHFLFKNDSIKSCCIKRKSAIGLTIDVKSGKRDCYEVLKSNGQNRAVEYDTEDYQTIPKWLHPLKGHPMRKKHTKETD